MSTVQKYTGNNSPIVIRNKHLDIENSTSSRSSSPKILRKIPEMDGVTALVIGDHPDERIEMIDLVSRISAGEQREFIFPFIKYAHVVIKNIDLLSKVCSIWPYLKNEFPHFHPNMLFLPFRNYVSRQNNRLYINSQTAVLRPGPDVLGEHTALTFACSYYDIEVIRKLIEEGDDINQRNAAGNTPLLLAAGYNRLDVVDLLIQKGADMDIKNVEGLTSINSACRFGNIEVAKRLLSAKQSNLKMDDNLAPIHIATCAGDFEMVQQNLADETKDLQTNEGWAPIHFACKIGNLEMVQLFFTLKNQHLLTKDGKTPLLIARENNHSEIIKFITSQISLTSH